MRTEDSNGQIDISFLTARSRVAPKELCAALTAAQLAVLLQRELTVSINSTTFWTDSTTLLTWLQTPVNLRCL